MESTELTYLDTMSRLNYAVFKLIQEVHNFKMLIMNSNIWGQIKNNTWHGSIGFVVRNEVDFSITSLRWSLERYGYFEATTHSYSCRKVFQLN